MTQHRSDNNDSTAVQAYKDYQSIPEERDEVMYDFEYWVRNEWSYDKSYKIPKTEEDLIILMKQAIAQYMMEDKKSQALIKAGEQELLKSWIGK